MQSQTVQDTTQRYYPKIRKIARGIARHLPAYVDAEDLVQAGAVGMMTALRAFDSSRTGNLDAYLDRRIRGAILDELRALDPLSRDQRRDARSIEGATRELATELGRAPEETEVAERSGLEIGRLRKVRVRQMAAGWESLDSERAVGLADSSFINPLESLEISESREQLEHAICQLSPRQQQVLQLYYVEEFSLKEIGKLLGVTESRVCQIHTEVTRVLREAIDLLQNSNRRAQ